jgi:hypothetical protein
VCHPIVLWKNTIYPLMCWFVNYSWELYLASIQLLDVNEVVIIIIILGEPQHPDFIMIIASRLCELYKEN